MRICDSRHATIPASAASPRLRRRWHAASLLLALCAVCTGASAAVFGPAGVQPAYISTSAQAVEYPSTAVFADFNGDGYPDAAVLDVGTHTLMIYTGSPIGTLTPTHEYGIFNLSFYDGIDASISTADLDGDGKLDLVVGDQNGVSILLGVGDASASFVAANPQRPKLPSTMGWGVSKTVLRDINGDGRPDIVMMRNDPGGIIDALGVTHVTVLLNAGGGKFGPPDDYSAGSNTSYPNSLALAPFDGDGIADIVFYDASGGSSKLYFMKGKADGTFQSAQVLADPAPQGVTFAEAVDIDGDGKMDYLMSFGSRMSWIKGNGDGTFQPAKVILPDTGSLLHSYDPSARPVIGDFNHDGLPDVAMAGRIFVQQADHSFQQVETVGWGDSTFMLAGTDLNGDLRTDLLTSGPDPKHLAVFKTTAGPATHMILTGGNHQSTVFSTPFASPLTLKVLDANNVGVPNQQILFNGFHGLGAGATLNPGVTYTDGQGNASDTAVANNTIGCYTVQASLANSNIGLTYDLCNTGNDVLSVVGGDNQSTQINTAFATPLQVKLTTFGNVPKQGIPLTFKAPASGASAALSSTTAVTDANGLASIGATANGVAGSYDVQVSAPGAVPASLHLTNAAAAGSAAQIVVSLATSPQSAPINTAFAPLLVKVVDSGANPVAGATVVYTVGANPATGAAAVLAAGTAITDGSGNAQVGAAANGFIGDHTVKVSLQGNAAVPTQTIDLRNYARLPKAMALVGGTPQSTPTTTQFAQTLSVKLTDANGQPTPQVRVYFLPPASGAGASLSALSTLTDANGIAQVTATANGTAGSYQVGAAVFQTSIETPILVAFDLANTALPPPPPPQTAVPAPALGEWSLMLLIGTLLGLASPYLKWFEKKLEG